MYRFGRQQFGVIDPSSQTEDLGDDAMKASTYGIANLKRIVPNLIKWTAEDGKDYEDLETMYGQVLSQYNRYMGHVTANIGGVYEIYKTYDQEGAVYTHVSKDHQKKAMNFLQKELFETPDWMIDENILNKFESAGNLERIRSTQTRTLNSILDFGRMQRMLENQTINGNNAYALYDMMKDLRSGLWSELRSGKSIDIYRRNLQRAYLDRMEYLMTQEQPELTGFARRFSSTTEVDVDQSDIRAITRAELNTLQSAVRSASNSADTMTRIHLRDVLERIDNILNPKK